MRDCEQFSEGSRPRCICEGTANLPLYKINAYREQWGLAPLTEDQVTPYVPVSRYAEPARPPRTPRPDSVPPRLPRLQRPRTATVTGKKSGCGGCGGNKRRKLAPNGHGPGSKLLELFGTAGVPHCQACIDSAAKMDAWGVAGCQERLGEIVEDILPRAREWLTEERPWAHKLLSVTGLEDTALRVAVRQKIQQAISAC